METQEVLKQSTEREMKQCIMKFDISLICGWINEMFQTLELI